MRISDWSSDVCSSDLNLTALLVSAATGSAMSSERWVVAQQAISRLIAARAPLTVALADIDRLYVERSVEEQVDGLPAIYGLRDRLADLVSTPDAGIEELRAGLHGRCSLSLAPSPGCRPTQQLSRGTLVHPYSPEEPT